MKEKEKYGDSLRIKELDAYYFQPPSGESIAGVCLRIEHWLSDLKKSSSGLRVVCVCHGNVMKALRIRIEKIKQQDWIELENSVNTTENCHIIHYSRRDPYTGKISSDFKFMRSVCPWDTRRSANEWTEIMRPTFTSKELRETSEIIPRIVNNALGDNLTKLLAEEVELIHLDRLSREEIHEGEIKITEYE